MRKVLVILFTVLMLSCFGLAACSLPAIPLPSESSSIESSESAPSRPEDSSSSIEEESSSSGAVTPPDEDRHLRILFLGNSLMFFNDMPALFRDMATRAGKDVYVDSITRGSATISDFALVQRHTPSFKMKNGITLLLSHHAESPLMKTPPITQSFNLQRFCSQWRQKQVLKSYYTAYGVTTTEL